MVNNNWDVKSEKYIKIGFLGAGTWGTALANLLAKKGYSVLVWNRSSSLLKILDEKREHPKLKGYKLESSIKYIDSFEEVVKQADIIVESVTSAGIRPSLEEIKKYKILKDEIKPIILTSKGIEQHSGLLFPEVALDVWGEENKDKIGCLYGPSHAEEVIKSLPTTVVASAYDENYTKEIANIFNFNNFRVYPNNDILGVCFGGAMKNIIAIACAISDGLNFGDNTKAALMTRGLHEIRKLGLASKGCEPETINGLSGLGDLFVTCSSSLSRNYRFGRLLAEGYSLEKAKEKIGMAVEGIYTCVSAYELGKKFRVPLPITEATYSILFNGKSPKEAVKELLNRTIKDERL